MTYNIRSGRGVDGRLNLERIAEVIASETPDIVALQEVDRRRGRTRHQDQAALLAQQLGYHCLFGVARCWQQGQYGNALLSRFPPLDWGSLALPKPARLPVESRCLLQVRLQVPGGELHCWNTHLGLLAGERLQQVSLMLRYLSEQPDRRLVLCGDFNARPSSRELRSLSHHLRQVRSQRTFPGFLPVVQLDHVFHSQHLRVIRSSVPRTRLAARASDHLPLVVDLAWV